MACCSRWGRRFEVYNDPANLFVARFIGAPGMNLVEGLPVETAEGLAIDLGPLGLSPVLAPAQAAAARTAAGPVVYGFRPEQVAVAPGGEGLALTVDLVERIGARTIVHFGGAAQSLKAVVENRMNPDAGTLLRVLPHAEAVRLFDAASGQALRGN